MTKKILIVALVLGLVWMLDWLLFPLILLAAGYVVWQISSGR